MWYRIIVSAREVTDKRGLKTVHQTPAKFEHPVFPFDDPNMQGDYNLGSGAKNQAFGPGHYTATSPGVTKGYKDKGWEFRRDERLPKGTRIIHFDALTADEVKQIINGWNSKFKTNYNPEDHTNFSGMRELADLLKDENMDKLYPLLVELGYDAVEHNVARNAGGAQLDLNLEKLKTDPEYYTKDGRFKKRKFNRALERRTNTNIIVINRAIITKPDLFQKVRFRPDSVTPEEMQEYKDEIKTSKEEAYLEVLKNGGTPEMSVEDIVELLEKGYNFPQFVSRVETILDLDRTTKSFDDRLKNLKLLTKYFDDRVIYKLFTPREIEENRDLVRNNLFMGPQHQSINRTREAVLEYDEIEANLLRTAYDYVMTNCNNYGCGVSLEPNAKKCSKCGGDLIANWYWPKPNLDPITLINACKRLLSLKAVKGNLQNPKARNEYPHAFLVDQLIEEIIKHFSEFNNSKDFINYFNKFNIFRELYNNSQTSKLNDAYILKLNELMEIERSAQQPAPKVAYKILQKTAGKTKYYYFNGESKPLRDHLENIFPYANSVDIFYMMGRLRNKAMSDDQVANLLYEAAMGRLFPRFEDKRA
jgi:hypothetical protein